MALKTGPFGTRRTARQSVGQTGTFLGVIFAVRKRATVGLIPDGQCSPPWPRAARRVARRVERRAHSSRARAASRSDSPGPSCSSGLSVRPARPTGAVSQSHECSIRRVCRGGLETRRKTLKISGRDSRAERLSGGRGERDGANRPWKTRGKRGRTRTSRVRRSYVTCSNAP